MQIRVIFLVWETFFILFLVNKDKLYQEKEVLYGGPMPSCPNIQLGIDQMEIGPSDAQA